MASRGVICGREADKLSDQCLPGVGLPFPLPLTNSQNLNSQFVLLGDEVLG